MGDLDYFGRLKRHECPDATWRQKGISMPVLARGRGSMLWDVYGKSYIDLCSGFGALPLGHNHPSLRSLLSCQDDSLCQGLGDVLASKDKVEFLETITDQLPSQLELSILGVSGAQAVESAIKTALLHTGGDFVICFDSAYHGLDFGSLALTARKEFSRNFQKWLTSSERIWRLPTTVGLDELRSRLAKARARGFRLAAIIVEPVQGRGGIRPMPLPWLRGLASLAHEFDAPFILDEIMTGWRCGQLSFVERGVDADLVCFGKALSGGMPLSLCVGKRDFMSAWPENTGEAIHTGTFFGHPLSCRVARVTLECMRQDALVARANDLGRRIVSEFKQPFAAIPQIKELRGVGLMLGIEYSDPQMGSQAMGKLLQRGVLAIAGGDRGECLSLTPALNIEESLLRDALSIISSVSAEL